MSIHRVIFVVAIVVSVAVSARLFVDKSGRWLLMNRQAAETYALELFANDLSPLLPDKFVAYTISTVNGGVLFASRSGDGAIYGYFPNGNLPPSLQTNFDWEEMDGNWYVARARVPVIGSDQRWRVGVEPAQLLNWIAE